MRDLILKDPATGFTYLAKADVAGMSAEDLINGLASGSIPFRLYFNTVDIQQLGSYWNVENVLPTDTAQLLGLSETNPQIKDALDMIAPQLIQVITATKSGDAYTGTTPDGQAPKKGKIYTLIPSTVSANIASTFSLNGSTAAQFRINSGTTTGTLAQPQDAAFLTASAPVVVMWSGTYWIILNNLIKTYFIASNSTTAAATAAKVATCPGFVRAIGNKVKVTFTVQNTSTAPTLNINSTGAANMVSVSGTRLTGANLLANTEYEFTWDGTNYVTDIDPTVVAMFSQYF